MSPSGEWHSNKLDLFPSFSLTIGLWLDVDNGQQLRDLIVNRHLPVPADFHCCLLDASRIVDVVQIEAAASQALIHHSGQDMTARELATELVYCLSPSRSLTDALRCFGVSEGTSRLLIVLLHPCNEDASPTMNKLAQLVVGKGARLEAVDHLPRFASSQLDNILTFFSIPSRELDVASAAAFTDCDEVGRRHSALVDSILTRMAARDACRV